MSRDTGLDPLVQQSLHELIAEFRDDGRTVFLSSHTLSEVERVADRVGIIRHGQLVEVAAISDLKAIAIHRLDFEFAHKPDAAALRKIPGVRDIAGDGKHLSLFYEGSLDAILVEASRYGVTSIRSHDADLEEIFLEYYRDPGATGEVR